MIIQVIIQIIACTSSTFSTYIVSRCSSDHTLPLPKFRSTNLQTRKWQFDAICFQHLSAIYDESQGVFQSDRAPFIQSNQRGIPGTNHPNRTLICTWQNLKDPLSESSLSLCWHLPTTGIPVCREIQGNPEGRWNIQWYFGQRLRSTHVLQLRVIASHLFAFENFQSEKSLSFSLFFSLFLCIRHRAEVEASDPTPNLEVQHGATWCNCYVTARPIRYRMHFACVMWHEQSEGLEFLAGDSRKNRRIHINCWDSTKLCISPSSCSSMRNLPFAITSFATRQEHDIDVFTGYHLLDVIYKCLEEARKHLVHSSATQSAPGTIMVVWCRKRSLVDGRVMPRFYCSKVIYSHNQTVRFLTWT